MDTLKPLIISIVRTVLMPLLAGGVLSLLMLVNGGDPAASTQAAVASVLAMTWYLLARFLESKNRYWGLMLGVATTPTYQDNYTEDAIVTSVKRTLVPLLVGWALTVLAKAGLNLDAETVGLALQAGITSLYYGAIRLIERSKPKAGVLIGGQSSPTY